MKHRVWKRVDEFELQHKRNALRRLSRDASLKIYCSLCELGRELGSRARRTRANDEKLCAILRVHSLMNKIKA